AAFSPQGGRVKCRRRKASFPVQFVGEGPRAAAPESPMPPEGRQSNYRAKSSIKTVSGGLRLLPSNSAHRHGDQTTASFEPAARHDASAAAGDQAAATLAPGAGGRSSKRTRQ